MAQPTPQLRPKEKRQKDFSEVVLGYPKRTALEEARRCPQCSDPACVPGCPLGIDIPGFIRLLREGDVSGAYQKIREHNFFPGICGRVCFAPCEASCILQKEAAPIGIRAMERFAADHGRRRPAGRVPLATAKKVAVIGSGPAGLSAAAHLAAAGAAVTIFEELPSAGGVLRYGIPRFRLPDAVLDQEIDDLKAMGVEIKTHTRLGCTVQAADLLAQGYAAVLLALGTGGPQMNDLPGAHAGGVHYGEELLLAFHTTTPALFHQESPLKLGRRVAVLGGGNTALDCARIAARMGAEVTMVFHGTPEEMAVPAREQEYALDEGLRLETLVKVNAILPGPDERVAGVECVRLDYADPDSSGRWRPVAVPDSKFVLEADSVIIGTGHRVHVPASVLPPGMKVHKSGTVWVSQGMMTSMDGIFAAGDLIHGPSSVVAAMASGKAAAGYITRFLS